ncbi:hypothetical protein ZHAS_00002396 [Anopheles sinensis]|uniref:Uncharacterized protein n=1 Tax=Anopheles sinensis TaxID=74873 RepID=A0A084VC64_ANOSI|nr:hypothetical protein ZHAS_00002396 [Anopheles sinensis]
MKFAIVLLLALFAVACIEARPHPTEDDDAVAEVSAESAEESEVAVDAEADASAEIGIEAEIFDELVKDLESTPEGRKINWGKILLAAAEAVIDQIKSNKTTPQP